MTYNSYTMKFTLLKYTTQCFKVYKMVQTSTLSEFCKKKIYWGIIDLQCLLVSGFIPQRNPIPVSVDFQSWTFSSVTLIYMSVLLPEQCCLNYWGSQVIQELWCSISFQIGNCASYNLILLFQDCFDYSGFFMLPYKPYSLFSL